MRAIPGSLWTCHVVPSSVIEVLNPTSCIIHHKWPIRDTHVKGATCEHNVEQKWWIPYLDDSLYRVQEGL